MSDKLKKFFTRDTVEVILYVTLGATTGVLAGGVYATTAAASGILWAILAAFISVTVLTILFVFVAETLIYSVYGHDVVTE